MKYATKYTKSKVWTRSCSVCKKPVQGRKPSKLPPNVESPLLKIKER